MVKNIEQPLNLIGEGIQVFTPSLDTPSASITTSDTSQLVAIPTDVKLIRIACTADSYIAFGDNSVVADTSSSLYLVGVEPVGVPKGATHLAVIQKDTTGVCSLTYGQVVINAFTAN